MVDTELGTKRNCPSCASRFYDLNNHPITCPHCAETFVVEPILPSKADNQAPAAAPAAAAAAKAEEKPAAPVKENTAALEDDDNGDDADDDEVAAIADVDLGDDAEDIGKEESDKFLETDDDNGSNVSDIVAPGAKDDEDT